MAARPRKYDLIVFGATGYTGKLTSEQVLLHAPSSLRWAIAGRAPQKLQLLAAEYNRLHPDRRPVDVFIADLQEDSVERLAAATRCLISTVGPYIKYGTAVLEACAVYGTHYVDCTGEFPWVYDMVKRCHKTAQKRGAIIIPQAGFESAPMDLMTYLLVKTVRDELGCGVADVRMALHDIKARASGGTLETGMTLFETATLQEIREAAKPGALSPIKVPEQPFRWPIRNDEDLGTLTMFINEVGDRATVMRSWGLIDGGEYYGRNFTWKEYMRVSNIFSAVFFMLVFAVMAVAPIITPVRWLMRKVVKQPGEGPSEEERRDYFVEWCGIAEADEDVEHPRKASVFMQTPIGMDPYTLTGLLVVQVALSTLFNENTIARKLGGGVLTPATVATPEFFQALERAGVRMETKIM